MKHYEIEYAVPEWAVPYLANDDPSGLSAEEISIADKFCEEVSSDRTDGYHFGHFDFNTDDPDMGREFSWCPAFGLAGMCVPVKAVYIMDDETEFVKNLEGQSCLTYCVP